MGSLLSTPGVGFANAHKTQKHVSVLFGKHENGNQKIGSTSISDLELDAVLRDTLDEFEFSSPTPKGPPAVKPKDPAQAFRDIIDQTIALLAEHSVTPLQERVFSINPRKVDVATQLTDWMNTTLTNLGATVAVVSRQGGLQHKKYDKTEMLHTGIAMFHPREKKWKIYNLLDNSDGGVPQCEVRWTNPMDFFSQQGGYRKDALLLIPDKALQSRMHKALLNGDYKKLVFTQDYNLVSAPDSTTSLNCNKWILLNVLAAQKENYHLGTLLAEIKNNYRPGLIDVNPFVRLFAAQQPKIKASEVPWWGPIHTVTVESLYHSGLFEKTLFCDPESAGKQKLNR